MSYASTTTANNLAEYMGLSMGIRACLCHVWYPLHVVEDSNIILRQQRTRTTPMVQHLRSLLWQSRQLGDQLNVVTWQHRQWTFKHMYNNIRVLGSNSIWKNVFIYAISDIKHFVEYNLENPSELVVSTT
ncbi:hypothetical protein PHMEG_00036120 [Phytophthora megakarya]|uniref:RNase H type-1 domain-containing protein n=1 Tax=Phytophthora megakarya TaxID=4795 RepID=A0A225UNT8_9STRA|nr:hypothetical protein PHMEG_00036120 [Phytophthora megakarya]